MLQRELQVPRCGQRNVAMCSRQGQEVKLLCPKGLPLLTALQLRGWRYLQPRLRSLRELRHRRLSPLVLLPWLQQRHFRRRFLRQHEVQERTGQVAQRHHLALLELLSSDEFVIASPREGQATHATQL